MQTTTRLRIIGYTRVSTGQQADDGVSLEAQKARLTAYAMAHDLDLVEVVEDAGHSAKSLERPGIRRALGMLGSGLADGLLVVKLDRLTRSVRDLGDLIEKHFTRCSLMSIGDHIDTKTPSGRLVLNVIMSVSQWEREAISERTKEALAHLKAQGVRLGGPQLTDERTIGRIVELRKAGNSMRKIAQLLTVEGYSTLRGGEWGGETIRLVLKREKAA